MEKTFKETVKAMSAKEIIMEMVDSLKEPYYKIDMSDFGYSKDIKGIPTCFGCAATNTITKISGIIFTSKTINWTGRAKLITNSNISLGECQNEETRFLDKFELAIDYLRKGYIYNYNVIARRENIAKINNDEFNEDLPELSNEYTNEELEVYIKLANAQ